MSIYLLDTNTISDIVRGRPSVTSQAASKPISALQISVITQAEVLFGLARRPEATRVRRSVQELMARVAVLPWDGAAAEEYARLRAILQGKGRNIAALDLLIVAHAISLNAILVTADKALHQVKGLVVENWREAPTPPAPPWSARG